MDNEEGYEQVVLGVVQGEIHARLLQNVLAQEGIPSRIQAGGEDEFSATFPMGRRVYPFGTSTLMQVWVNKRDLARARGVWEAYEAEGGEGEAEGDEE